MPVPGTTLSSLRPMVQGRHGVVVASHPDAAMAGLDILKRGGNAVDAAVAVGLALNVVHSHECSLLGVAPMLVYRADRREVVSIDGLGVWPAAMSLEYLQAHHGGALPPGILRTLTPGAADAWFTALAEHGTLSFTEVAQAAIALADDGFPMYRFLAGAIAGAPKLYSAAPGTAAVFLPGGRAPSVGEMFRQQDLARSLRALVAAESAQASAGRVKALQAARDVVYTGDIARSIIAYCKSEGGLMTMEDLAACRVRNDPPARVDYRGLDVYCTGPWTQGPVFPQALKILEGFDLRAMGHNSAAYAHVVDQALNLAFADREAWIGDPAFVDVPLEQMLSEAYLRKRRTLIDPALAWPTLPPAGDPRRGLATAEGEPQSPAEAIVAAATAGEETSGTSYFGVIDRHGNVVSCIPSEGAKSGPIIPGTGLALSWRGFQSKTEPGHAAAIAPGKRPRLTPCPALVLRGGEPVMALGGYGGDHIPQSVLQVFLNIVEFGLDPQEAVEAARFYSYSFPNSQTPSSCNPGLMRVEQRVAAGVLESLRQLGHTVEAHPPWWEGACLNGALLRDPTSGVLQGGADPRGEAFAVAY